MKILLAGANSLSENFVRYYAFKSDFELIPFKVDCDLSNKPLDICKIHNPDIIVHTAVSLGDTNNNIAMYLALEQASLYCGKAIMVGSGANTVISAINLT